MRVFFLHRRGVFSAKGGEQRQIRKTKAELERLGANITLGDEAPGNLRGFDLLHCFGLDPRHIPQLQKTKGIPIALSTVFWDRSQGVLIDYLTDSWGKGFRRYFRKRLDRWFGITNQRVGLFFRGVMGDTLPSFASFQQVIDRIDVFLPNSEAEMWSLAMFYALEDPLYRVVPNAIDVDEIDKMSDYAEGLACVKPFVLTSGGIDRRKNQYSLIKALMDVDVPIVLAGAERDELYMEPLRHLSRKRGRVYLTGHLPAPDLNSLYYHAAVHALPSLHDTPGISNLEAVAHSCVNVGTAIGGLQEYLGHYSLYCNPFSIDHIRSQVLKALEMPPNLEGAKHVRENFTWRKAAEATMEGYNMLLRRA